MNQVRINLLPYREAARKVRRENFYRLCVLGAVLAGLVVFAIFTVINAYIAGKDEDNALLKREIAGLDRQIEQIKRLKDQLESVKSRKQVIESLQQDRSDTVHLLSELVKQMPDGTFLKSIKQDGSKITLGGYAQTNASVSVLMRNLDASLWLEKPQLVETKAVMLEKRHVQEFTLIANLTRSKAGDSKPGETKPGAAPNSTKGTP